MRKIKMMIELEYNDELHHGEDKSSIDWFGQSVLMNDTEDGGLILHSNEIGDEVGRVKTLIVYDWPPKRSSRPDLNQLAAAIVAEATGEIEPTEKPEEPKKNQAAVELGRLGGKRGGKARAEKLTPEERSEIAKKAATARWHKK